MFFLMYRRTTANWSDLSLTGSYCAALGEPVSDGRIHKALVPVPDGAFELRWTSCNGPMSGTFLWGSSSKRKSSSG
jgi:hypothetical protein